MINMQEATDIELTTLVKAMHEARFPRDHFDPIVWNLPQVIEMHTSALSEAQRRNL